MCATETIADHALASPHGHMKQWPQAMVKGMTTRSPGSRLVTSEPTSSTMPIGSWPRMSPSSKKGPHFVQVEVRSTDPCRSHPHDGIGGFLDTRIGDGTDLNLPFDLPCHSPHSHPPSSRVSDRYPIRPPPTVPRVGGSCPRRSSSLEDALIRGGTGMGSGLTRRGSAIIQIGVSSHATPEPRVPEAQPVLGLPARPLFGRKMGHPKRPGVCTDTTLRR